MADSFSTCLESAMMAGGAGNLIVQNSVTNFKKLDKLARTYNFVDMQAAN
jgi:hypothetical protein